MPILDPTTHTVTFFKMPVADPNAPESFGPPLHPNATPKPMQPSAYWGDEKIWSQRANNQNGMFDEKGRVSFAAADARSQDDEVQLHRYLLRHPPPAVRL